MQTPELDPSAVPDPPSLCRLLGLLLVKQGMTTRDVERIARRKALTLSRSTVSRMTNGEFPGKRQYLALLQCAGIDDEEREGWVKAWERLAIGRVIERAQLEDSRPVSPEDQEKAESIIEDANRRADAIVAEAVERARAVMTQAETEAHDLIRRAESLSAAETEDEVIPVDIGGTTTLVRRTAVHYVEADGDHSLLHTAEGTHRVRIPLSVLDGHWHDHGFTRIHRSYLVATARVAELKLVGSGYCVRMASGGELPVSRRHTRLLRDRLVRATRQAWARR